MASTPVPRQHPFPSRRALAALIGGGILVASIAAAAIIARRTEETRSGVFVAISPVTVPLLRDALDDYRRVTAGDLPGRGRDLDVVRDAVPFPVEPLRAPEVRLLAAWTADLSGEPAAVLAYRRGDRVVLEYLVSEERFFRDPAVRRAVRDGRVLGASAGRQGIAAWPTKAAGAILVGDLPADQLATLVTADLLARRVDRGAQ